MPDQGIFKLQGVERNLLRDVSHDNPPQSNARKALLLSLSRTYTSLPNTNSNGVASADGGLDRAYPLLDMAPAIEEVRNQVVDTSVSWRTTFRELGPEGEDHQSRLALTPDCVGLCTKLINVPRCKIPPLLIHAADASPGFKSRHSVHRLAKDFFRSDRKFQVAPIPSTRSS